MRGFDKIPLKTRSVKSKIPVTRGAVTEDIKALFTQDWCPVQDILYGMVKMKSWAGGKYIKIVEVKPINFLLQTYEERADNIITFYEWLKIAPTHLQFHMTTTQKDVSGLIRSIYKKTENETDACVIARRDAYIKKIKDLSFSDSLSKRFYIIYSYEGGDNGVSSDIEEIAETMYQIMGNIQYYFGKIGNSVVQNEDDNMFMATLLYNEMNPRSCMTESFDSRVARIVTDTQSYAYSMGREYDIGKIPIQDYIAPRGINTSFASYTVRDGMFITYLYIKGDGYRHSVFSGWMEEFTNFGNGVSVSIYADRKNRDRMIESAGRIMRIKRSEARDAQISDENQEIYLSSAENARFIKDTMQDNGEDIYDVCILITIRANTHKALETKKNQIKRRLRSKEYYVEDCYNHCEGADYMSLPLLMQDAAIFKKGKKNMLTSSLASTYFFTAFELYDDNGILLGYNGVNSSLAAPDLFNASIYKNANIMITGTSGMGKTYLLQQLGYAFRLSGYSVSYILPHKGHEYYQACKQINGEFISLAPGARTCINIMAIRPQEEADSSMIDDGDDLVSESLLSKKVHQVITFIQLSKPKEQMTDAEETQLNIVLTKLYKEYGITDDNESIWIDKAKKLLKPMPILGDLYDRCVIDDILKPRVAVSLLPFVEGTCVNMNGQTNVNLDNKYKIFDVSNAGKQFLPAFAFIAVDCAYDGVKKDRTELCALIMDELWKMMLNIYCAEFVMEIYKIIRGYGGAAIAATQDITDFLSFEGGVYGKKVISTSKIKFVLGAEKDELEVLKDVIDLSEAEIKQIIRYDRGQVLMVANGEKIPIYIKGTDEENRIFTTDPTLIKRYREEDKYQRDKALREEAKKRDTVAAANAATAESKRSE